MFELFRSLKRNKRLLKDFVVRDLKARYVGSSMGFFWSVIYPIVNLFVYMFVFSVVLKMRWSDQADTAQVAIVMLTGILVWVAFAESVSRATNTLVENANLIQKVVFPAEILPPFLTLSSLFNMMIGIPIVMAGVLWVGYLSPSDAQASASAAAVEQADPAPPPEKVAVPGEGVNPKYEQSDAKPHVLRFGPQLVLVPVLILFQAMFTLGLGYFLALFNLFLRDTFHLIGVAINVWMFATPIFYPAELVANSNAPFVPYILEVNPMHWLVDAWRHCLLYGEWPDFDHLLRFCAVAVLVYWAGSRFFMTHRARIPDML